MLPSLWKDEDIVPFSHLRSSWDRLFDRFLDHSWPVAAKTNGDFHIPAVDVRELEDSVVVEVELPGFTSKDVNIEATAEELTIRAEKKREEEKKTKTYYRREMSYGKFERRVPLPVAIDTGKVEASYTNGILQVTLAKQPGTKAKTVAVKVK